MEELYKCFKTPQPINKLYIYIALVSIASVQAISLMKYLRLAVNHSADRVTREVTMLPFQLWASFSSVSDQPCVSLMVYPRCYTRCWLLLCYSSVLLSLSLLLQKCVCVCVCVCACVCVCVCVSVREQGRSELRRTWNRSCFDDVPEVLGSELLSFSLQITAQINTLALTDPQQAMPLESHPQGLLA